MPGRNDACPCGSGKKYKRCCLRDDERKRAAEMQNSGPTRADHDPELAAWLTSISRLRDMLAPGGCLADLRFNTHRFQLMADVYGPSTAELIAAASWPDEERSFLDTILEAGFRELVQDDDWVNRATKAITSVPKRKLRRSQKLTLATALETLRLGLEGDDPAPGPLALAVAETQIQLHMKTRLLEERLASDGDGEAGEYQDAVAHMGAQRGLDWLECRDAPSLLSDALFLEAMVALTTEGLQGEALEQRCSDLLAEADLPARQAEHLQTVDDDRREAYTRAWTHLSHAVALRPVVVLPTLVLNGHPGLAVDLEARLTALAEDLDARGLDDRAARVRRGIPQVMSPR